MAMKKGFLTGALAGVSVAAVALAGAGLKWPAAMADERPAVNQIGAAPNFAPPPGAPFSFADIYERVAPAVVPAPAVAPAAPAALRTIASSAARSAR